MSKHQQQQHRVKANESTRARQNGEMEQKENVRNEIQRNREQEIRHRAPGVRFSPFPAGTGPGWGVLCALRNQITAMMKLMVTMIPPWNSMRRRHHHHRCIQQQQHRRFGRQGSLIISPLQPQAKTGVTGWKNLSQNAVGSEQIYPTKNHHQPVILCSLCRSLSLSLLSALLGVTIRSFDNTKLFLSESYSLEAAAEE